LRQTLRYLGLARKAGALATGSDACEIGMKRGEIRLVLVTEDTGENTLEKVRRSAAARGVPLLLYGTSGEVGQATGSPGRHVFGITDENFAETVRKSIENEENRSNARIEEEVTRRSPDESEG